MLSLYSRMAAYVNHAQPKDRYNIRRSDIALPHGNPRAGTAPNWATSVAICLSCESSLKGYFEALTERDRFAQIDQALEPWDIWLTPLRQHLPSSRLERR